MAGFGLVGKDTEVVVVVVGGDDVGNESIEFGCVSVGWISGGCVFGLEDGVVNGKVGDGVEDTGVVRWEEVEGVSGCEALLTHAFGGGLSAEDDVLFESFWFEV